MASASILTRSELVRRGQRLEYFTIGYNSLEGLVSIVAGIIAGSVSLIGFGLDSLIEVTSGAALLWRFHHDLDHSRREQIERTTLRIVGGWVLHCPCAVHPLRIRLHADRPRCTRAEHPRHHRRCRLGGGDAVAGARQAAGCIWNREPSDGSRFPADGLLHVSLSNSLGRVASECRCRVVVGRSGGWTGDGPDHRQRRR